MSAGRWTHRGNERTTRHLMGLASQTIGLLRGAAALARELAADAVLLLCDTDLDWDAVTAHLGDCKVLVATTNPQLYLRLKACPAIVPLEIDAGPVPTQERMSLAILEAVANEQLRSGAHLVTVYNGIVVDEDESDNPLDSLSVI